MAVKFKPHHFLCTLAFEGKGYSPAFVSNYFKIIESLKNEAISVTFFADSICSPCPNKIGNACVTQEKIDRLDRAHAEILDLKEGDSLSWQDARKRLKKQMSLELFHRACEPCGWKALGICESKLKELINEPPST